jgi:hypothetical protein
VTDVAPLYELRAPSGAHPLVWSDGARTTIVELERRTWHSPVAVELEGLGACLALFGVTADE